VNWSVLLNIDIGAEGWSHWTSPSSVALRAWQFQPRVPFLPAGVWLWGATNETVVRFERNGIRLLAPEDTTPPLALEPFIEWTRAHRANRENFPIELTERPPGYVGQIGWKIVDVMATVLLTKVTGPLEAAAIFGLIPSAGVIR